MCVLGWVELVHVFTDTCSYLGHEGQQQRRRGSVAAAVAFGVQFDALLDVGHGYQGECVLLFLLQTRGGGGGRGRRRSGSGTLTSFLFLLLCQQCQFIRSHAHCMPHQIERPARIATVGLYFLLQQSQRAVVDHMWANAGSDNVLEGRRMVGPEHAQTLGRMRWHDAVLGEQFLEARVNLMEWWVGADITVERDDKIK